jgi:hypothetical protein
MRHGANLLALPCSSTRAPPAKVVGPKIRDANAGQSERTALRLREEALSLTGCRCAARSLLGLRYREVLSMKDRPGRAPLVQSLGRTERIRLLVD